MQRRKLLIGAIVLSGVVHCSILVVFGLIQYGMIEQPPILIETVFSDAREQMEFSKELDINTEISENLNPIAGGAVTGAVGASSGPPISQQRIEMSQTLQQPELLANVSEFSLPSQNLLGEDLGSGAVMGETGAIVSGYGPALSRLTRELLRMMREQKVLVVWMFDESESMKDDQKQIAEQFHKVYEELGIAFKKDEALKGNGGDEYEDKILLTAVTSFGKNLRFLTERPTDDVAKIRKAIEGIRIDESGKENMCQAVIKTIAKFGRMSARQDRKLVLVMVSDESGDDGMLIEQAVQACKSAEAPVYILGRESVFGYPYARQLWVDPKTGLKFWPRIKRGPETAFREALQWDGFAARDDAYASGFGPYTQVRLVKESGGIFFMLPGEEVNLAGRGSNDDRKFQYLSMKEYEPALASRRKYKISRAQSEFRTTISRVIARLDPAIDSTLSIRRYSYRPQELITEGKANFTKAVRALTLTNQAIQILTKAKPGRAHEESWRWRAAYDLIRAQTLAYRVRLFQYLLALDQLVKNPPPFKNPKSNEWDLAYTKKLLPPDPVQVKLTGVNLETLKKQRELATQFYNYVIEQHPGTPWAVRAKDELNRGFGIYFREDYNDPRYYNPKIRNSIDVPNL